MIARVVWCGVLGILATAPVLRAQGTRRPQAALMAGWSSFDLSGTGSTGVSTLAVTFPVTGVLIVEPSLAFFRYRTQFTVSETHLFPEIGLYAQGRLGRWAPYAGGGAGWSLLVDPSGSPEATLFAAGGTRLALGRQWGARFELRVRTVDPFVGTTADLQAGLTRRL